MLTRITLTWISLLISIFSIFLTNCRWYDYGSTFHFYHPCEIFRIGLNWTWCPLLILILWISISCWLNFSCADGYISVLSVLYLLWTIPGYMEDSPDQHCHSTRLVFQNSLITNIHMGWHTRISTLFCISSTVCCDPRYVAFCFIFPSCLQFIFWNLCLC